MIKQLCKYIQIYLNLIYILQKKQTSPHIQKQQSKSKFLFHLQQHCCRNRPTAYTSLTLTGFNRQRPLMKSGHVDSWHVAKEQVWHSSCQNVHKCIESFLSFNSKGSKSSNAFKQQVLFLLAKFVGEGNIRCIIYTYIVLNIYDIMFTRYYYTLTGKPLSLTCSSKRP